MSVDEHHPVVPLGLQSLNLPRAYCLRFCDAAVDPLTELSRILADTDTDTDAVTQTQSSLELKHLSLYLFIQEEVLLQQVLDLLNQRCPKLESLEIVLWSISLTTIRWPTSLRRLSIEGDSEFEAEIIFPSSLSSWTQLEELSLPSTNLYPEDAHLRHLPAGLRKLTLGGFESWSLFASQPFDVFAALPRTLVELKYHSQCFDTLAAPEYFRIDSLPDSLQRIEFPLPHQVVTRWPSALDPRQVKTEYTREEARRHSDSSSISIGPWKGTYHHPLAPGSSAPQSPLGITNIRKCFLVACLLAFLILLVKRKAIPLILQE